MPRKEFGRKVRKHIIDRATGFCENKSCGAKIKGTAFEIDHILPIALGGDCSASNGQLVCIPCHKAKTKGDVRKTRKADRQRDKAIGAFLKPKTKIKSRGFAKSPKSKKIDKAAIDALANIKPKQLYRRTGE